MITKKIAELAESVFSFDYVGDSMMAVRRDLNNEELQKNLAKELVEAMISKSGDDSAESRALYAEAAMARVEQFVKSSKASKGSGCG